MQDLRLVTGIIGYRSRAAQTQSRRQVAVSKLQNKAVHDNRLASEQRAYLI